MFELEGVNVLKHNSIRIAKEKIIYIDPFQIDIESHDADIILCTHSHYDHFSPKDILKIAHSGTLMIVTHDCEEQVKEMGFAEENIVLAKPGDCFDYDGIIVEAIPAYNKFKVFHPRKNNWVGYIITANDTRYYIAGDTDKTKEACQVQCDVAFVPVGGTYTMDYKEAASLITKIRPMYALPTHYGLIVGEPSDGLAFKDLLENEDTKVEVHY